MSHPLEAKLRPAYELHAAVVSAAAAGALIASPATFMLSPDLSPALAAILAAHAAWRAWSGSRVLRYRLQLRRLRPYQMSSADIPCSSECLFLGRGFRWDQRHTQRLYEAHLPENQYLLEPGFMRRVVRALLRQRLQIPAQRGSPNRMSG